MRSFAAFLIFFALFFSLVMIGEHIEKKAVDRWYAEHWIPQDKCPLAPSNITFEPPSPGVIIIMEEGVKCESMDAHRMRCFRTKP
jgi:hypothetical protein